MTQKNNKPRVPFRQVLDATTIHPDGIACRFFAVIIDPDTQKRIVSVPIFDCAPDEVVELALERETLFADEKK